MAITSAIDLDTQITISIYLRRDTHENGMTLEEYSNAVIAGTQPILEHDAFVYQFGALEDRIVLIKDWALSNNLTIVSENKGTATVQVLGTARTFNTLFDIDLKTVLDNDGRSYHTFEDTLNIPSEINDVVELILGLDNSIFYKSQAVNYNDLVPLDKIAEFTTTTYVSSPTAVPGARAVLPSEVATAYNFPPGTGYGGCVGLLLLTFSGYQTGYRTSDVRDSFARVGLSAPNIVNINVNGAIPLTDSSDGESMLDIFCSGVIVPEATIAYYTAPNSQQGFLDCILAVANDTTNNPTALGISWASVEISDYLAIGLQACIAKGISCFSAAGDWGAGFSTIRSVVPLYPASSPYQISVGGTKLLLNADNSVYSETAWSLTGGGISNVSARPSWQAGLTYRTYSVSSGTGTTSTLTMRGYPDISAPADPVTGYQFYVNGGLNLVGGTSAGAPLLAAMVVRLNSLLGKRIGFTNEFMYANPRAFTDITAGDNSNYVGQGYISTPGWDAVTGLGSPNGLELYKLLRTGLTFPLVNNGVRPTSGITYPRPLINKRKPLPELLRTHILNSTLELIRGKTATDVTTKLFNSDNVTYNPAAFTYGLDMTGRWLDINAAGVLADQGNCCLISPQHTITAAHAYGQGDVGSRTAFRGRDGSIHIRVTKAVYQSGTLSDTKISLLDNFLDGVYVGPVPSSVTPCKLLPENYEVYLPRSSASAVNNIPLIINTGWNRANAVGGEYIIITGVSELNGSSGFMYNYPCSLPSPIIEWSKGSGVVAKGGDSNHPSYFLINGELVLLGMQYATILTLNYGNRISEIQTAINQLSDNAGGISQNYPRQPLRTADLSMFYRVG
jgi:kumamolisin